MLPGNIGVAYDFDADVIRVEAVAIISFVIRPPVGNAVKLYKFSLANFSNCIGGCAGFWSPVEVAHPVFIQLMEMSGHRIDVDLFQ